VEQFASYGTPLAGPVSSDSIESALATAWHAATASADPTHPPVRASVLSLIVCVVHPTTADDVLDAVGHLSRQHPSRALILVPDATFGKRDLDVWTSTGCTTKESFDQPVCAEQIIIAARGHAPRLLPPLADQIILHDLPSFLWWTGDLPADDALLRRLTGLADRVIIDSSTFQAFGTATSRLNRLVRQRSQPAAFSDLSWGRLTPWRELLSQFFDAPAMRARLVDLDRLAIEYDPSDDTGPAQAALLLGWLTECLKWRFEGEPLGLGAGFEGRLARGDGGAIEVSVRPSAERGLGGLRRVRLGAGDAASFLVERDANDDHALTQAEVSGAPPLRRSVRFESSDVSTLLADELMLFGHDHQYEGALAIVAGLAG
jgi:glucose-6-phosphate dehydrogenase assembly protein OpcA